MISEKELENIKPGDWFIPSVVIDRSLPETSSDFSGSTFYNSEEPIKVLEILEREHEDPSLYHDPGYRVLVAALLVSTEGIRKNKIIYLRPYRIERIINNQEEIALLELAYG